MATTQSQENRAKQPRKKNSSKASGIALDVDKSTFANLKLVAVAYSEVKREWFPTEEAYEAEREVEGRAQQVVAELEKLGITAKGYPADPYFLTNLLVDHPDLVLNLVDTLRGRDALQTSIPAALELANIPYTGAGMRGMVIGNDRNLFKQLLDANDIPTPDFQLISRRGSRINPELGLPLIVKLNESGGSVGIDNRAVKETVNEMLSTYHMPVVVERFIDGPEITAVVFDDGQRKHIFLAQKKFRKKPDGKHNFTSLESYSDPLSYTYTCLKDDTMERKLQGLVSKAFTALHNRDYAKFDIRVEEENGTPYFTDCNPNTAFGPSKGLPFTEVLDLYGVKFETVLASLISKHAKEIEKTHV
jgi:D-alanine-D-alanine ligase